MKTDGESNHSLRAYDYLKRKLRSGDLQPGMRLVNRALAQEIGVSYTPVREAINRLTSEGFLEHIPGIGVYVRIPDPRDIQELMGIREALETYAITEAVRYITDEQIAVLQSFCDEWLQVMRANRTFQFTEEQIRLWLSLDQSFHQTLIASANNHLLTKFIRDQRLLERIFGTLQMEGRPGAKSVHDFNPVSWPRIWRQHAALVRALRRRDVESARHWITVQVRDTAKQFAAYFEYRRQIESGGTGRQDMLEVVRRYSNS